MPPDAIEFSKQDRVRLVQSIQDYFRDELDQDIGQFQAGFLLDFFSETFGPHYYNQALLDAQAVVDMKLESINEGIDGLTRAGPLGR